MAAISPTRAYVRLLNIFGPRRRELWSKAGSHGLFVAAPVSLLILVAAIRANSFAVDFDHGMWVAGGRVLVGSSPYVGPHSPEVVAGSPFVFPALMAILSVPFSLLPRLEADGLFTAICVLAAFGTLRLCAVRDWRIYGLVFLWPAVISGWQTANITLLISLGIAAAWRVRDRPLAVGMLVAVLVSAKLFLWPLAVWLLATRRYRAFAWSVAGGVTLNLAAWAIVGFDQVGRYLQLMAALTKFRERHAYSILSLAYGLGRTEAYVAAAAVAGAILIVAVVLGRRGRDQSAFALSVAACLLVTPLVWLHYFALLIVPLALAKPRLAPIWLIPVLMWSSPTSPTRPQTLVALVIAGLVIWKSLQDLASRAQPDRSELVSNAAHGPAKEPALA